MAVIPRHRVVRLPILFHPSSKLHGHGPYRLPEQRLYPTMGNQMRPVCKPSEIERPSSARRTGRKVRSVSRSPISANFWDLDKENDVVARAKLEAKKKFGDTQSEEERQAWISQRIKEDFDRLMNRFAVQFSPELAPLEPFQAGFGEQFFANPHKFIGVNQHALQAGKLVAAVLPALAESKVSKRSQSAADALIGALEKFNPCTEDFHGNASLVQALRCHQRRRQSSRILACAAPGLLTQSQT